MVKYLAEKLAPTVKDSARFLQFWSRVQQKGMLRYVLLAGVLGFGIPWLFLMFVGRVLFDIVVHTQPLMQSLPARFDEFSTFAAVWIGAAVLAGILFGLWMWYYNSYLYRYLLHRAGAYTDS